MLARPEEEVADRLFTEEQRQAQRQYGNPDRATRIANAMVGIRALDEEQKAYLEALPFFFLATADGRGNVQCNFKGGGPGLLRVEDSTTLWWPEFPGNDMLLSLGNMVAHPHAGILAIAMTGKPRRLKVNGGVRLEEPAASPFRDAWPEARVWVRMRIGQVIRNCARRIPLFTEVPKEE